MEEVFGPKGTLGRETPGEVVLVSRLRGALEKLNPALPPRVSAAAVDNLVLDRPDMSQDESIHEISNRLLLSEKHQ